MMRLGLWLVCASTAASAAFAAGERPHKDYSWKWVRDTIKKKKISTVEGLLEALPEDLRSHYALMFRSHSKQPASPQAPRVILFWDQGRKLAAFNSGEGEVAGANSFEFIEFNDRNDRFEFHEADFSRKKPRFDKKLDCAGCHSQDFRPNWDPYDSWPGAYFGTTEMKIFPEDRDLEKERYFRFVEKSKAHPRYGKLMKRLDYETGTGGYDDGDDGLVYANFVLTEQVASLNFRRMARLIRATRDYDKFKYVIAGAFTCAFTRDELSGFFPKKWLPLYERPSRCANPFEYLFERRGIDTRGWFLSFIYPENIICDINRTPSAPGAWRSIIVGPLVASDPDLSPFFKTEPFSYHGSEAITPELANEGSCAALAEKSREVLERLEPRRNMVALAAKRAQKESASYELVEPASVARRCLECHSGLPGARASKIPFDDPKALERVMLNDRGKLLTEILIRTSPFASEGVRMPPEGERLNDRERSALLHIFEKPAKTLAWP